MSYWDKILTLGAEARSRSPLDEAAEQTRREQAARDAVVGGPPVTHRRVWATGKSPGGLTVEMTYRRGKMPDLQLEMAEAGYYIEVRRNPKSYRPVSFLYSGRDKDVAYRMFQSYIRGNT